MDFNVGQLIFLKDHKKNIIRGIVIKVDGDDVTFAFFIRNGSINYSTYNKIKSKAYFNIFTSDTQKVLAGIKENG